MLRLSLMRRDTQPGGSDVQNPSATRSAEFCPANLLRCLIAYSLGVLVAGCANRVEYFVDQTYPPRGKDSSIEWLVSAPPRPHIELAQITVSSSIFSDDTLRQQMLDRARRLGADAVVVRTPVVKMSMAPTPYFEPGILGPMGASFGLYGYGWYTPYSSNPFILTQGATNVPRIDKFFSGVAIRYLEEATASEH